MNWPWLKRIASLTLLQLCALTAAMSQPSNGDVELLRQQVVSGGEIQRDAAFQQLVELLPESRPALIAALDDHWTAYFARFSQLSVFKELDRIHGLRCELLRSRQVALSMLVVGGTSTEPDSSPSNEAAQIRAVERLLRLWESRERVSIENGVPNALFSQLKWNQFARASHDCPLPQALKSAVPAWLLLVRPEDRVFTMHNVPADAADQLSMEAHRTFVAEMRVPGNGNPGPDEPMSSEKGALIAIAELRAMFGFPPHNWSAAIHRAFSEVFRRSSRESVLLRLERNDPELTRELTKQTDWIDPRQAAASAPVMSAFPLDAWTRKGNVGDTARWICTHFRNRSAAFESNALASCAIWSKSGVWIVAVR